MATQKPDTWPQWISLPAHVAQAADWVRWKTQGRVFLVVAIGPNSIALAKDRELSPEDAIKVLEAELHRLRELGRDMQANKQTHGFARRENGPK